MEQAVRTWLEQEKASAVQFLQKLVKINSFTANIAGVNQVQDILEKELRSFGLRVERIAEEECGDQLVARSETSGEQDILFIGHVDTVHPPESSFNSFSTRENLAFGPGVLDMKGGIVVLLWALKAAHFSGILNELPLTVVINSDEEIRSKDSRHTTREQAKRARSAFVFEWERADRGLINKRKGIKDFEITVRGKAAHAGNGHREGRNAVAALARILVQIDELTDYEKGITTTLGTISGGLPPTTVSDYAACDFEVRATSNQQLEQIDRRLKAFEEDFSRDGITVSISETRFLPPLVETEENLALFQSFHQSARRAGFDARLIPEVIGGASDACVIGNCGVPCIDGFGPFGEFAHTEQEYIVLDSLWPKILSVAFWLLEQHH